MNTLAQSSRKPKAFIHNIIRYKFLYLLILPTIVLFLIFNYFPMYGVVIAFQDYKPHLGVEGMFSKATWVGLKQFKNFISSFYFKRLMINTVRISLLKILFGFPAPIILALFLNEIRNLKFKKIVQTVSYLPHFLSWVILSGIITSLLSPANGTINQFIIALGGQPVDFLTNNDYFIWVLVFSSVWQGVGWSSIIYLATLSGIDPQLYESSVIDGATRFQQILYISLPSLYNLMSILLIMSMGGILNAGFEQVLMLYSPLVFETGDIIDTFVYRSGIQELKYSYSSAVGLFKTAIGFTLLIITNFFAGKMGRETLF
ncbi:MAG TPA: ABC transporter permease subunit [Clostridiales bacterium]|nr:ABC transporter permease subunit [Clostridiales bacterium]